MEDCKLRIWRMEDAKEIAVYANNRKVAENLRNTFPYPYTLSNSVSCEPARWACITGCLDKVYLVEQRKL